MVGFVLAQKIDPKSDALIRRFPEFGRSDRAEFLAGGRYESSIANQRLDPPKDILARCWIPRPKLVRILVQIQQGSGISEIVRDSSIGTRRNFCRVVVDLIPHNSTEVIIYETLEEAVAADTSLLSRKTARLREGNVDVEPPSSMDDSSMILIEIGVGVDEGLHTNMTIGGRAQSSVKPR